ncbi:MAG: dTMP kinase [Alphaproteobacteria bacterium]|nr:dTMP kinase [Alphaproteobacteria bacterium]
MRQAGRSLFVTLEGGEGGGKSTQARRLTETLRGRGLDVELTREPGGSPAAEALRPLLLTGDAARWSPQAETLLMYAGRDDHLNAVIRPALARGAIVICDRFADSTEAYQGAAGGMPPEFIGVLRKAVVGATEPDLTLIFDLPPEEGLRRAGLRGGEARFESKGIAYHRRLRAAFLDIARRDAARCVVIDATLDPDTVFRTALAAIDAKLGA